MLGFGFISHTDAGQIEGSWCPVSAERSFPRQVKLLQEARISSPWSLRVKSFLSLHVLNLGKIPQGQRTTGPPHWREFCSSGRLLTLLGFFLKQTGITCFFCLVWCLFGFFWLNLFSERPFYFKLSTAKYSAPGSWRFSTMNSWNQDPCQEVPTHLPSGGTAASSNYMESDLQIKSETVKESVIRRIISL